MTNSNTSTHTIMNAGPNQTDRKRKVSGTSESSSSLDTLSDDSEQREPPDLRKIARLGSRKRTSENSASSSSKRDSSSDSDAETSEKCPVCLKALKSQILAITDTCAHHTFCLSCLQQWSKKRKTCPVDRIPYDCILVLDSKGNVTEELPVKIATVEECSPHQEPLPCDVCGLLNNQAAMLVCDGCRTGFHLYCLIPPMDNHPVAPWLCGDCWYYYHY